MLQRNLLCVAAIVVVICSDDSGASEQYPESVNRLQGVVVSARRAEEKVESSVKSVDRLSVEDIASIQPSNIAQALASVANVELVGGARPLSQEITIRGIGGDRIVRIVDGARQNFSGGHRGSYFVEPDFLQRVEVVKGGVGSVWGSGAIGGVVAMQTKSAEDYLQQGQEQGFSLSTGYASASGENNVGAAVYGLLGEADYLMHVISRDTDDIRVGGGDKLESSAVENTAVLAKLGWNPGRHQRVTLSYQHLNADQEVPSNPTTNPVAAPNSSNPLVARKTDQRFATLSYEINNDAVDWLNLQVRGYWNETDIREGCMGFCGVALGGPRRKDTSTYTTRGMSISNTFSWSWAQWVYGIDYYKDKVQSSRNGRRREQYPKSEAEVFATFVQASIPLWERLSLHPAVRYDRFHSAAANEDLPDVEENEVSGSLSTVWRVAPWLVLTASFDEAFRAPGTVEMYPTGVHFDLFAEGDINAANNPFPGVPASPALNNVFIPNPNINPEKAKNKELSARFIFSDVVGNDELRLRITAFRNDIEDFIDQIVQVDVAHYMDAYFSSAFNPALSFEDLFDPSRVSTQFRNVNNAEFKGVELDIAYDIAMTSIAMSYGNTSAEDSDSGRDMDVPADRLVLNISHKLLQGDVVAGVRLSLTDQRKAVAEGVDDMDNYSIGDLYLSWEPAVGKLTGLRLNLSVNNAGDVNYRRSRFALPAIGRNAQLGLSYRF